MSRKTREAYVWSQFFAAVKGWQYHPGNLKGSDHGVLPRLTTAECARIADEMADEYLDRYGQLPEEND